MRQRTEQFQRFAVLSRITDFCPCDSSILNPSSVVLHDSIRRGLPDAARQTAAAVLVVPFDPITNRPPSAVWYADDRDNGWRSLDLKSSPALMGIDGGEIKWTVSGVMNDPKTVDAVVRRWVEY